MREDLIELAKQQAAEIARAGHNGWGNTMLALAAALEAAREDAEDVAKWRAYEAGGGEGTSHVCVRCGHPYWPEGENEDCPKCGHDGSAIDQARGKGVVG